MAVKTSSGRMFFWQDENGRNVASCKFDPNGEMASINLVYTRPEYRRKHYAENIVYQVTKRAIDAGYVPMYHADDIKKLDAQYQPEVKATVGADGTIVFTDSKGKVLLKAGASSFKAITEGLDKGAWEISQSWALDPDEPIYGLGMLQNGKMSQRGENREMIQSNLEDFQNFFQSI